MNSRPVQPLCGLALCVAAAAAMSQTAVPVAAAASAPAHTRCEAPEQRQFDFWVGRWNVIDTDGSQAGENRIERIDGGCVLIERWRGAEGMTGTSLNSWSAATKQWHQHWVDNRGGMLRLAGGLEGRNMVLASSTPHPRKPGVNVRDRITWTPLPDGAVRQWWQRSEDDGASWTTAFDGRYVRQK